jgi:DNA-binding CsgD family transcriptional regulator
MAHLSSRDLNDIMTVSHSALGCSDIDELRRTVLNLVEPVFKAERGNFFLAQPVNNRLNLDSIESRGIGQAYLDSFRTHYHRCDPFLRTLLCFESNVVTTEEILPYQDLMKTVYYNEFLKPQGIYSQLVIYLRSGRRQLGVVALFRPRSRPIFSAEERTKAALLVPSLTAAVERAAMLDEMAQKQTIIDGICSELGQRGLVVLSGSLKPVYMNGAARDMLALFSGRQKICPDGPGMPDLLRERCRVLIGPPSRPEGEKEENLVLRPPRSDQAIQVHLRTTVGCDREPILVLCMGPENAHSEPAVVGKTGLTRREIEVSALVCEGMSNREIGERLFISEFTVINHLRSIYEKLGVKNRTSLVRAMNQKP